MLRTKIFPVKTSQIPSAKAEGLRRHQHLDKVFAERRGFSSHSLKGTIKGKKMEISTISSKGQVTIPKKIRDFLNVRTFDKIAFIPLKDGQVLITTKQNSATSLFGMLKHRKPKKPVSIEEMEAIIRVRRAKRGMK
jgi:antitoxin PrlF